MRSRCIFARCWSLVCAHAMYCSVLQLKPATPVGTGKRWKQIGETSYVVYASFLTPSVSVGIQLVHPSGFNVHR